MNSLARLCAAICGTVIHLPALAANPDASGGIPEGIYVVIVNNPSGVAEGHTSFRREAHCLAVRRVSDMKVALYLASQQTHAACYLEGSARTDNGSLKMSHEDVLQLSPGEDAEIYVDGKNIRVKSSARHACGQMADFRAISIPLSARRPFSKAQASTELEKLCPKSKR
jgi:hypothetical protein